MTYATPQALRMALEDRLRNRSAQMGISLDRLRRRVVFERVVARLEAAEPGQWVLKGGMALEVRLGDDARLTKDLDLGLRSEIDTAGNLHERLVEALVAHRDGDGFELAAATPQLLQADRAGHVTWRVSVAARLAGRTFSGLRLDVSPRAHELVATEHVVLPNSLDFAGIPDAVIEIVDVNCHAAEKFHAMLHDFGSRENTRVRDLVDLVLLAEHHLVAPDRLAEAVRRVCGAGWRGATCRLAAATGVVARPLRAARCGSRWRDPHLRRCRQVDPRHVGPDVPASERPRRLTATRRAPAPSGTPVGIEYTSDPHLGPLH